MAIVYVHLPNCTAAHEASTVADIIEININIVANLGFCARRTLDMLELVAYVSPFCAREFGMMYEVEPMSSLSQVDSSIRYRLLKFLLTVFIKIHLGLVRVLR